MKRETIVGTLAALIGIAAITSLWSKPDDKRAREHASSTRPSQPETPTISGLRRGRPVPVPGFGHLNDCATPTLTDDLLTIVCARLVEGSGWHLYEAKRLSVEGNFTEPRLLQETISSGVDAYPALSPNGLELIFWRNAPESQLWITSRESREASFNTPVPWEISRPAERVIQIGTPQFMGPDKVVFSQINAAGKRTLWSCERLGRQFQRPRLECEPEGTPTLWLSVDSQRAYYASPDGKFFFIARTSRFNHFKPALCVASAAGLVDGPIWLAPQEDVIIYCASSAERPSGSGGRLMQLSF